MGASSIRSVSKPPAFGGDLHIKEGEGFSKFLITSDDQRQPGNFVKRPLSLLGLELERPGLAGSSVVCSTLTGWAVAPHELNNTCLQMVLDMMLDD